MSQAGCQAGQRGFPPRCHQHPLQHTIVLQRLALSKDALALEVRSATMEYGLTLKVVCETDTSADGQWPRDVASAACVTWMRGCCDCNSCVQKAWWKCEPGLESTTRQKWEHRYEANDLAFERNTPSATSGLELMDGGGDSPRGCRGSKRLPCIDLEREERARDKWLVLDLCGNGHRNPDGVVG